MAPGRVMHTSSPGPSNGKERQRHQVQGLARVGHEHDVAALGALMQRATRSRATDGLGGLTDRRQIAQGVAFMSS
ncbi:MAG: hypothetical protein ACLSVD_17705 [Eggerthellaceae bacterium]